MAKPQEPEAERRPARVALEPIKNVVVGMSLLEGSEAVVAAAIEVGQAVSGRLTVVHSVPAQVLAPSLSADWHQSDLREKWFEAQRREVADRVERLGQLLPSSARVESGPPHRAILSAADAVGADLIVIGASERGRFARVLGGTADRVLRRARCPVLVVRGDWRFPIERVLMPVDFSLLATEAYDCGLCFLSQIGASKPRVELFYAESEHLRAITESLGAERFDRFVHRELERFGRSSEAADQVTLSYRSAVGAPAREILDEAERFDAGLIVIGTNGQGGVERALIGSVARVVAVEAGCPVLFIPPEIALGASIAEAVLEQTEPRWNGAEAFETATRARAQEDAP